MLSLNGLINLIKTNMPPPFLKAMRSNLDLCIINDTENYKIIFTKIWILIKSKAPTDNSN